MWLQPTCPLAASMVNVSSTSVRPFSSMNSPVFNEAGVLPSVFPSGDPGVSGDFWGSQERCQGLPPPQDPSPLRGTLGSSLRSPAEGEGKFAGTLSAVL